MPIRADDLRGLLRLSADAGIGVADIAEGLHRAIVAPSGSPSALRRAAPLG